MPLPRISARIGSAVSLTTTFYRNGIAENPFAVRRIDIYAGAVREENLVASIAIPDPAETAYPLPLLNPSAGVFTLEFDVPCDFEGSLAYFDVWNFIGSEDCGAVSDLDDETIWQSQCNNFYVFPEGFFLDDGLIVPRLGFEALDLKLRKGEIRTIEVGIMPLPLYDYDANRINPIIPQITPLITIETTQKEVLIDKEAGKMGIRQGSYRSNPYTAQFTLDTTAFLKGTYVYRVHLPLPNGEIRISPSFRFTIC